MWYVFCFIIGVVIGNVSRTAWASRAAGRAWRWVERKLGK